MEKYKEITKSGDGSFGSVTKALNTQTGEIVAIKKMKQKFTTWEECMNLRELKSLKKLTNHPNVIKLKEVVRVNDELSFVFEFVETDVYKLYEEQKKLGQTLTEPVVRSIFYQIASALAYVHKHGFFHRDLKPENLLYNKEIGLIKLIDFGLVREIRSRPPYTDYVSTRWYRAPEILLRSTNYNSPVDIFALGCIMAELFQGKPLFNGVNEVDQLNKICSVLGTPSKNDWTEGYRLALQKGFSFPSYQPISLQQVISNAPPEAVNLIAECLRWDPSKRPTAQKILSHPYFNDINKILPQQVMQYTNQPELILKKKQDEQMPQQIVSLQQTPQFSSRLNNSRLGQSKEEKIFHEQFYDGNLENLTLDQQQQSQQKPPSATINTNRTNDKAQKVTLQLKPDLMTNIDLTHTNIDNSDSNNYANNINNSNNNNSKQQTSQQQQHHLKINENFDFEQPKSKGTNDQSSDNKTQKSLELDSIYEFLNNMDPSTQNNGNNSSNSGNQTNNTNCNNLPSNNYTHNSSNSSNNVGSTKPPSQHQQQLNMPNFDVISKKPVTQISNKQQSSINLKINMPNHFQSVTPSLQERSGNNYLGSNNNISTKNYYQNALQDNQNYYGSSMEYRNYNVPNSNNLISKQNKYEVLKPNYINYPNNNNNINPSLDVNGIQPNVNNENLEHQGYYGVYNPSAGGSRKLSQFINKNQVNPPNNNQLATNIYQVNPTNAQYLYLNPNNVTSINNATNSNNTNSNLTVTTNNVQVQQQYIPYEQGARSFSRNNGNQQPYSKSFGSTNHQLNKITVGASNNGNLINNYPIVTNYKLLNKEENSYSNININKFSFKPPIYQPTYSNALTPNFAQPNGNQKISQNNMYNFNNI